MQEFYTKSISTDRWDSVGIAICKPYVYNEATTVTIGYTENNRAYVGEASMSMYYILGETVDLGPAVDIKVCYDARWRGDGSGQYNYFTIGQPYIATIDTANRLYIRQGATGAPILLATGVEKCYMVRGWKHIYIPDKDQGLCVFYIRNGTVFSRSYVEQSDGSFVWLAEETYNSLGSTIKDISVKRTSDFRLMIAANNGAGNKLAVTTRMFPGMSVPTEVVMIQNNGHSEITLTPITLRNENVAETIRINASGVPTYSLQDLRATQPLGVFNTSCRTIWLRLTVNPSLDSISTDAYNIIISDSLGYTFPVISAQIQDFYIVLTVMDFSNAVGSLLINYEAGMFVYTGIELTPFNIQFTPIGLVPVTPNNPLVTEIINVDTEVV